MTSPRQQRDFGMRGLRRALARLPEAAHDDMPVVAAEALYWATALDDHYYQHFKGQNYPNEQKKDAAGRVMYALRYARGRITHALALPGCLFSGGYASLYESGYGSGPWWRWVDAATLGLRDNPSTDDKARQALYQDVIAGRNLTDPLPALIKWFEVAQNRWPEP